MTQINLWSDDNEENKSGADAKQHGPRRQYRSFWDVPDTENIDDFDGFGGYGYTARDDGTADGYSARSTIDDSSDYWYGQSSFRYRRHVDYSPSRLFRTFTSRYSSYSDNEAQNKAIRALRVLTRNANTITDNNKNGTYSVQFSDGSKTNANADELNDDKQRVVYVTPDELLATATTDAEDAVVDALTGFVMLRVQMAQTLDGNVIRQLNAAALHGIGLKIAHCLFARKADIATATHEELQQIAAESADYYMAGTLAKSIAMRLARRGVIENWGGFAAYFIQHAKKFSEKRETLSAAGLSLEVLVNQIAYNMLDDEKAIELPKFAVDTITKWLGAEVAADKLLDTCVQIVAELRAHFTETGSPVADENSIETAIAEMLDKAQKEQSTKTTPSALESCLTEMANSAFDVYETKNDWQNAVARLNDSVNIEQNNIKLARSLEQLLRAIENALARKLDTNESVRLAASDIRSSIGSRPRAHKAIEAAGREEDLKNFCERLTEINVDFSAPADKLLEQLREAIDKFTAVAKPTIKATIAAAETKITATVEKTDELMEKLLAKLPELCDTVEKTNEKVAHIAESASEVPATLRTSFQLSASRARAYVSADEQQLKNARIRCTELVEKIKRARSASGTETIINEVQQVLTNTAKKLTAELLQDYAAFHSDAQLRALLFDIHNVTSRDDKAKRVAAAVATALHSRELRSDEIIALLANEFFKPDPVHPNGLTNYAHDEIATLEERHPEHKDTIQNILDALRTAAGTAGATTAEKEKITSIAETTVAAISGMHDSTAPVDEELFGKKIDVKTKVLDGTAIVRANDEARNDPEEEYIAYISGGDENAAKPVVRTEKEHRRHGGIDVIKKIRMKYRSFIDRIRGALQFQAGKRTEEQFGLRSGDLDEGGLYKLNYDSEHIWSRKTTSRLPDVAVGILVDQSGSMNGGKIDQARTLCIVLAEALRKIAGVRLYVYGHTANTQNGSDLVVYEHYTPAMGPDMTRLGNITAHSNNYDGYAIKDVAKRLAADPAKKKYLFVIADGLPAGSGYCGGDAQKHVKSVCKFIRTRLKIGLYAFAVGTSSYERKNFTEQYDEKHIVFVDNVLTCLPQIVRFLRNALQKEKKLIAENID